MPTHNLFWKCMDLAYITKYLFNLLIYSILHNFKSQNMYTCLKNNLQTSSGICPHLFRRSWRSPEMETHQTNKSIKEWIYAKEFAVPHKLLQFTHDPKSEAIGYIPCLFMYYNFIICIKIMMAMQCSMKMISVEYLQFTYVPTAKQYIPFLFIY